MSDDLKRLKTKIYEDENIEKLLSELGCHSIKPEQSGQLITAGLPDGDNSRSIQVKNCEELYMSIRSKGVDGNIFTLVGYILYECATFDDVRAKLYQIKQWICNVLSYDDFTFSDFDKPKPKKDWNYWLRPIQEARTKEIEVSKNEILDERILKQYVNYPWYEWFKNGISINTQREYGIGVDINSERVTIPIHNKDGQLIGVKARYFGSDKKILDDKKYTYLYPCSKSIELFNLHRALPHIQEKKEVIVLEGGKSTMILNSWLIKNSVSIEGDSISPIQAKLLKEMGLDIDIILAFDKDKNEDYIRQQVKQIKNRRIYYLWDEDNLFKDEKASPVDIDYETWMVLYNDGHKHRIS
jgi:DNA primase